MVIGLSCTRTFSYTIWRISNGRVMKPRDDMVEGSRYEFDLGYQSLRSDREVCE